MILTLEFKHDIATCRSCVMSQELSSLVGNVSENEKMEKMNVPLKEYFTFFLPYPKACFISLCNMKYVEVGNWRTGCLIGIASKQSVWQRRDRTFWQKCNLTIVQ